MIKIQSLNSYHLNHSSKFHILSIKISEGELNWTHIIYRLKALFKSRLFIEVNAAFGSICVLTMALIVPLFYCSLVYVTMVNNSYNDVIKTWMVCLPYCNISTEFSPYELFKDSIPWSTTYLYLEQNSLFRLSQIWN
jgi:hypothetical protein